MKGSEQIAEVDQSIELALDKIEQLQLFNFRLENIRLELNRLQAVRNQLEYKFTNRLKAYDRLMKLPTLIKKLLSDKYDVDQVSTEFASVKMNYDAICKEIELLVYEQKILEQKKQNLSTAHHQLDHLIEQKESLLEEFKYPLFRQLSSINLEIYSTSRKIKNCEKLNHKANTLIKSIELIVFAMIELARAFVWSREEEPRYAFSYAQRQKIKWIGRKLIEIKVDLEKLISELEIILPEPEYYKLHFKTNHFVEFYIDNMIKIVKEKIFRFEGLDDELLSLIKILKTQKEHIRTKKLNLKDHLLALEKQKKKMVIGL